MVNFGIGYPFNALVSGIGFDFGNMHYFLMVHFGVVNFTMIQYCYPLVATTGFNNCFNRNVRCLDRSSPGEAIRLNSIKSYSTFDLN